MIRRGGVALRIAVTRRVALMIAHARGMVVADARRPRAMIAVAIVILPVAVLLLLPVADISLPTCLKLIPSVLLSILKWSIFISVKVVHFNWITPLS